MAGWVFALVYAVVVIAFQNWWDRNIPRYWRYTPSRKWRVSRLWLLIKAWGLILLPLFPVFWFLDFDITTILWASFGAVAGLAAFAWVACRIVGEAFFGQPYRALVADGWDPMFDTWMLGFLNRDPEEVRAGKPPRCLVGSNWQPPRSWKEKCPHCGATQPSDIFWCWHCGNGYEEGRQKMCCPDCDTTFVESAPGRGKVVPVECPGCHKCWYMPGFTGPDTVTLLRPKVTSNGTNRLIRPGGPFPGPSTVPIDWN